MMTIYPNVNNGMMIKNMLSLWLRALLKSVFTGVTGVDQPSIEDRRTYCILNRLEMFWITRNLKKIWFE